MCAGAASGRAHATASPSPGTTRAARCSKCASCVPASVPPRTRRRRRRASRGQDARVPGRHRAFRDAGLRQDGPYYYTVFARHPRGEWVRWGEYELRPGSGATYGAGVGCSPLPLAAPCCCCSCRPPPSPRAAARPSRGRTASRTAETGAECRRPRPPTGRPGGGRRAGRHAPTRQSPRGAAPRACRPAPPSSPLAGRERPARRRGLAAAPVQDDRPEPPYETVEHHVRVSDLTGLQVDVLLEGGRSSRSCRSTARRSSSCARRPGRRSLVPVVHGPAVGARAGLPRGRRPLDRARLAALARLEPPAAVDDPSRPPVHRPPRRHPVPARGFAWQVYEGFVRGDRRRPSAPTRAPATWPRCRSCFPAGPLPRRAASSSAPAAPRAWGCSPSSPRRQRLQPGGGRDRHGHQPQSLVLHPARRALHLLASRVPSPPGSMGWSRTRRVTADRRRERQAASHRRPARAASAGSARSSCRPGRRRRRAWAPVPSSRNGRRAARPPDSSIPAARRRYPRPRRRSGRSARRPRRARPCPSCRRARWRSSRAGVHERQRRLVLRRAPGVRLSSRPRPCRRQSRHQGPSSSSPRARTSCGPPPIRFAILVTCPSSTSETGYPSSPRVFVHPDATIIGDVVLEEGRERVAGRGPSR